MKKQNCVVGFVGNFYQVSHILHFIVLRRAVLFCTVLEYMYDSINVYSARTRTSQG